MTEHFVRNCWYVAAWSHEIHDDKLSTRTILGEPVAAFTEDRKMIEAQQRTIDIGKAEDMVVLPFDVALVQFRRAIAELLNKESSSHTSP